MRCIPPLFFLPIGLALFSGCGTGTYTERMEESKVRLNKISAYYDLVSPRRSPTYKHGDASAEEQGPQPSGITLQLPKIFDNSRAEDWRSLDHFEETYASKGNAYLEFFSDKGRARLPMMAWFLHYPVRASKRSAQAQAMRVAQLFGADDSPEWETFFVTIQAGKPKEIELMRLTLEGEFLYPAYDKASPPLERKGRADIYLWKQDDQFVIAVWSAPEAIVPPQFFEAAALSTATLSLPELPDDSPEGNNPAVEPEGPQFFD